MLQLTDVLWVAIFGIGLCIFCLSARFKWITAPQLLLFLILKMLLGVGLATWDVWSRADSDTFVYYFRGQEFSTMLQDWIGGRSFEYLHTTPFWGLDGISTDRLASFTGLLLTLTGNSYLAATLTLGMLGATGQLLIYRYLRERFPMIGPGYFMPVLFHPSLMVWSALLLKDPVGILAIGLVVYYGDRMLLAPTTSRIAPLAVGLYLAYSFRSFILVLMFIFFVFSFYDRRIVKDTDQRVKERGWIRLLYVYVSVSLSVIIFIVYMINYGRDMVDMQRDSDLMYSQIDAGSTFQNASLGFSVKGLGALPIGTMNAILRPFPWEPRKANQAVAAVENLIMLIFVFRGWWIYFYKVPKHMKRSISWLMWGSLFISIICATGVGLYASNLGTISRYRIPLIPFLAMGPGLALGTAALARKRKFRGGLVGNRLSAIRVV